MKIFCPNCSLYMEGIDSNFVCERCELCVTVKPFAKGGMVSTPEKVGLRYVAEDSHAVQPNADGKPIELYEVNQELAKGVNVSISITNCSETHRKEIFQRMMNAMKNEFTEMEELDDDNNSNT